MTTHKKTNWTDKEQLKRLVADSSSYNEVLKKLNLKPVTSNSKTLKKYILKYKIDTSHFSFEKTKDYDVKDGHEPWFKLNAVLHRPQEGLRVELDWNAEFVSFLKKVGFTGENEEEIIGKWLNMLYRPLSEKMVE